MSRLLCTAELNKSEFERKDGNRLRATSVKRVSENADTFLILLKLKVQCHSTEIVKVFLLTLILEQ